MKDQRVTDQGFGDDFETVKGNKCTSTGRPRERTPRVVAKNNIVQSWKGEKQSRGRLVSLAHAVALKLVITCRTNE